jgi:hypothetical protein
MFVTLTNAAEALQMINQPSLAILIDCWESPNPNKELPNNIISFIEKNDNIDTVALASYNCKQADNRHWFHNYVEIFNTKQTSRKIRDLSYVHKVFNQYDNKYPTENTNQIILDYVNKNKTQLTMTWLWELEYYLSTRPDIKNIYVLGQTWENCVRIRPLGYQNLIEMPNVNILTNTNCVLTMAGKFPVPEDSEWERVADTIWKYKHE